jgi:hypothetical protein
MSSANTPAREPGGPDPELNALAGALRSLTPRPAALDRDALLFRAGAAAAPRRWLWPAATATSSTAALALALAVLCRPTPAPVEHVVYVYVERPAPQALPAPDPGPGEEPPSVPVEALGPSARSAHQRLQDSLLRWGLDGLGEPAPLSGPVPRPAGARRTLFSSVPPSGDLLP